MRNSSCSGSWQQQLECAGAGTLPMTPPASGNWEYTMKLWAALDRIAKVPTAAAAYCLFQHVCSRAPVAPENDRLLNSC